MTSKQQLSGAAIIMESLLRQGIREVFGYPGGAVIPLYDEMYKNYVQKGKLRHILVRHEQASAFAANSRGRMTGKAGVCIATSGPGATNLVTGVADAMMDSVPLVVITGQVLSHLIGSDAFQEVDAIGTMMPVVKHSMFIDNTEDLEQAMVEAFHIAETGRPGPVHVDVTKDAFLAMTDYTGSKQPQLRGYKPTTEGSDLQVKRAIEALQKAERPLVLLGHGALLADAEEEIRHFVETTGVPVVTTLHGISGLPTNHPQLLSMLGMHGSVYANYATYHADLIFSLGSRFDDRITGRLDDFSPGAKILHIDIDPAELSKNVYAHVPIVGDIKKTLQKMNQKIQKLAIEDWWKQIELWKKEQPLEKVTPSKTGIRAPEAIQILGEETKGEAIVATDVGQHQMFVAQHYPFQKWNSFLSSGGLGSMGAGLPLAMGAKVVTPEEEVWSISGDGGFQMNLQELATLMQDEIDVKILILNNRFLGMVRQWQELYHKKNYASTEMYNPDFVKLAESYGVPGFFANSPASLRDAIQKARKHKGPALIECLVTKEENVFPMVDPGASLRETRVQ